MQKWYPELRPGKAPAFLRLLEAIEKDVSSGSLAVGAKLPTQRDLAERLGLSVGTVIKAYAEGQRRSLLVGHVGRGTFVAEQRQSVQSRGRVIDLSLNIPGPSRLPKVLADSRWTFPSDISDYVGYLSQSGVMDH